MLAHFLISCWSHDAWCWPKRVAVSENERVFLSAWCWPVCVSSTDLDEVHDLGWKQLTRYYRQAVDIAKTITGQRNESEAVSEFKSRLKSYSLYLNKQPFPRNESGEEALQKCIKSKCCRVKCVRRARMLLIHQESGSSGLKSLRETGAFGLYSSPSLCLSHPG